MCPAKELLFGGSKGGGKTGFLVACVAPILELAHKKWQETGRDQSTVRCMVFRKHLNDLDDFIAKSRAVYPFLDPQMGLDGWKEKAKMWRFSSGATVEINHLADPKSHESFNGNEFAALLVDEVQYIPQEAYIFLMAQVRSSDPDFRKLNMIRCTANPGGPHGDWVKKWWHIDTHKDGGEVFVNTVKINDGREIPTTRAFLRSYLRDNPALDPDGTYEASLRGSMNADEVRMFMDGDFDCVAGAFFSSLLDIKVHFERSRPVPASWEMMHSTDWGASAPACTLWGARDENNRVYILDELHRPGVTGRTYGEAMREKYKLQKWSKDHVWQTDDFWGVIDTQAMDRYGSEATAAAGIMEKGFRIFGADKLPGERKVGIEQIKERLLPDRHGNPQLVIFEDRCPHLARALKGIESRAPIDPEDYNPDSPLAHAVDALRFMLMKWPVKSVIHEHPLDAEVARWQRIHKAQQSGGNTDGRYQSGY